MTTRPLRPRASEGGWLDIPRDWIASLGDIVRFTGQVFGDVFNGRVFHRSFPNRSKDRFRRAYVCHYCNARSWVPWNHGASFEGDCANNLHILARGWSHLPFAKPKYGTPVDLSPPKEGEQPGRMVGYPGGDMEPESGLSAHRDTPVG